MAAGAGADSGRGRGRDAGSDWASRFKQASAAKRLSDRAYDRQPIGNDRRGFFVRFGVSKQNYDATPL
ncbi:hypothetical protein, partial [Aeromonas caviae]|uniref:hypothetical protein n=1 Tax=Aeromonas caviae TaxID=648 RepID=UPI00403A3FE4